ncbi:hypothetical protein JYU34_008405 [Plutella xylostella]|uniref:UBR-type domain-containing protein n=1 Tax=Plutella xylostella TaxID=51655 RepID=A0ABQ7QKW2_PLUXY|nr:hypothetical protein JYU34_008405 [Plutella xylostella]
MDTNGVSTPEDAEMPECDGEKVVTMMDVLQEQQDFEDDANAVLGASDDKECTYSKGYIKRQAIYACLTCCSEAKADPAKRAGVCLACSLNCHEGHELVELYTKRNFRCDCGNPHFNSHPCQYTPSKTQLNNDNNYNQNFNGLYCTCHRPYPDPDNPVEDEMIQCIMCEDWLHSSHLEATVPGSDQFSEMICKLCMEKNDFLHDYTGFAVNILENEDVDVTNDSIIKDSSFLNGDFTKDEGNNDSIVGDVNSEAKPDEQPVAKEDVTPDTVCERTEKEETGSEQNNELAPEKDKTDEESVESKLETEKPEQDKIVSENIDVPSLASDSIESASSESKTQLDTEPQKPDETDNQKEDIPEKSVSDESKINEISTAANTDKANSEKGPGGDADPSEDNKEIDAIDKLLAEGDEKPESINTEVKPVENTEEQKVETNTETVTEKVESSTGVESDKKTEESDVNNEVKIDEAPSSIEDADKKEAEVDVSITDKTTADVEMAAENTNGASEDISDMSVTLENCVNENKENKRKLSTEEIQEESEIKKPKLDDNKACVRPKGVKRIFKGATFWPSAFRQKLCACSECLTMYKDLSVLYLIDPEDTVSAYEALGKEKTNGKATQYEKGLEALSSLDRIQQINALTEYNNMRDKLLDFLKSFKDRKEVVKEEDIKAFFAGIKPKREDDGVYFCR